MPTAAPSTSAIPTSSPNPTYLEYSSFCTRFSSISSIGSRLSISDTENADELFSNFWWAPAINPNPGLRVYRNGAVHLEGPPAYCVGNCFDVAVRPTPRIVVAQSDRQPILGVGAIYAAQVADAFVISWEGLRPDDEDNQSGFNFQVVLYPSGSIEMRWGDGNPKSDGFSIDAFLNDGVNVTVPVTGAPFIESSNTSGIAHGWPMNQCRLFTVNPDGEYVQVE